MSKHAEFGGRGEYDIVEKKGSYTRNEITLECTEFWHFQKESSKPHLWFWTEMRNKVLKFWRSTSWTLKLTLCADTHTFFCWFIFPRLDCWVEATKPRSTPGSQWEPSAGFAPGSPSAENPDKAQPEKSLVHPPRTRPSHKRPKKRLQLWLFAL